MVLGSNPAVVTFLTCYFFLRFLSFLHYERKQLTVFLRQTSEFRSQTFIEVVFAIYVYAMANVARGSVSRLGSGALSWVRIVLGDR